MVFLWFSYGPRRLILLILPRFSITRWLYTTLSLRFLFCQIKVNLFRRRHNELISGGTIASAFQNFPTDSLASLKLFRHKLLVQFIKYTSILCNAERRPVIKSYIILFWMRSKLNWIDWLIYNDVQAHDLDDRFVLYNGPCEDGLMSCQIPKSLL